MFSPWNQDGIAGLSNAESHFYLTLFAFGVVDAFPAAVISARLAELKALLTMLEVRETLSVAEAADGPGANRHTLKDKFNELVQKGYAELHGKGRGAHDRRVKG